MKKHNLKDQLDQYLDQQYYPMHMPGHKRRVAVMPECVLRYDLTEVSGTDDLHHAEGMLREAMERTSALTGADRSWYLVNGSTCGNLAGVSAIVPYDGEVIVARNCHRSVFHAIELRHAHPHWLWPSMDPATGIFDSIRPEAVEALLDEYPESRAVVLTSPSYEGVVSDIRRIAEICHRHGVPLMVDEAHGAHLGLVPEAGFPDSAIHQGADISVQSAHKTLLGMTQTAYLHLRGDRVSESVIEEKLSIFETSSPSYPLMLSLAGCTEWVEREGQKIFKDWAAALHEFDGAIRSLRHLRVLCHGEDAVNAHAFYAFDQSKLVIDCTATRLSGYALMDLLRTYFRYELEMAQPGYALAMTGPGDDFTELPRFSEALRMIDRALDEDAEESADPAYTGVDAAGVDVDMSDLRETVRRKCMSDPMAEVRNGGASARRTTVDSPSLREAAPEEMVETPCAAVEAPVEMVPLAALKGRVSGEYVYSYPPGIPILVPGERITEAMVRYLQQAEKRYDELRYSRSDDVEGSVACLVQG